MHNAGVKIVIAEDSAIQAESLRRVLVAEGYSVYIAKDGAEGLAKAKEVKPEMVISDIMMPEMNGFELCRHIKDDPDIGSTPVVLLTSLSDPEDVISGLECGADNFIVKPYDERQLLSRIKHIQLNRELRINERTQMGVEIHFSGKKYFITSEKKQILDLLISTYESAVQKNVELAKAQEELEKLNEQLEQRVRERTAALDEEIEVRRKTEDALRFSEIKYRRLFEAAKDGILILNADTGTVTDINPFLLGLLGFSLEQVVGKAVWDIGFFRDIVANRANFLELQQKGYVRYEDLPLETADGRKLEVEFVSNVYLVNQQKVIQCNIRDITERKRAEKALEQLMNQYELILRSAGEGIIGEDVNGMVTFMNPAAEKMLGYSAETLIGRSGHSAWHHTKAGGDPYPEKDCPMIRACRDGKIYGGIDEWFWRSDGTRFLAEYIAAPIREEDVVAGMVVILRDVSQRKMLQEAEVARIAADTSNKAKSDFLANMSHELRTPMNAVIGFSEVLQDEMYGKLNEKQQEYVENIHSSGKHLLNLINDILDLAKVESGKMSLDLRKVSLKEILNASLVMVKEHAMRHGLELGCEIQPEVDIELEADERKLKQVLYNLLSNAVKFTPEGGSVRVSARLTRDEGRGTKDERREMSNEDIRRLSEQSERSSIEISVADTGIGIKTEDLSKLFTEFTQLESAYTKGYEGTGLGLALTRRLVELQGGRIWAESEFGKGSKFTFILPVPGIEPGGRTSKGDGSKTAIA